VGFDVRGGGETQYENLPGGIERLRGVRSSGELLTTLEKRWGTECMITE
jgi:hypothetical protein